MSYDTWLEAPYQQAAAEGEAYDAWCESENLNPDDDHWTAFREAMDAAAEDAEIERYEAMLEDRALDALMERDW